MVKKLSSWLNKQNKHDSDNCDGHLGCPLAEQTSMTVIIVMVVLAEQTSMTVTLVMFILEGILFKLHLPYDILP